MYRGFRIHLFLLLLSVTIGFSAKTAVGVFPNTANSHGDNYQYLHAAPSATGLLIIGLEDTEDRSILKKITNPLLFFSYNNKFGFRPDFRIKKVSKTAFGKGFCPPVPRYILYHKLQIDTI